MKLLSLLNVHQCVSNGSDEQALEASNYFLRKFHLPCSELLEAERVEFNYLPSFNKCFAVQHSNLTETLQRGKPNFAFMRSANTTVALHNLDEMCISPEAMRGEHKNPESLH